MRGKKAKKRVYKKDPKYGSYLIERFVNKIMLDGKKSVSRELFYVALESAAKEANMEPADFITAVVDKLRPALEVRSRRVGGANYQIPMPVSARRQESLAIRWLVDTARKKSGTTFDKLLKKELQDSFHETGEAYAKKLNIEKMAEANKAFAHFRW